MTISSVYNFSQFYFYQILTSFNKSKIMSEVVLLLPNTNLLQQVKDYVWGCTTSTKYWLPSTSQRLCLRLYYFYQILTSFNKSKIMSKVATWQLKKVKTIYRFHVLVFDKGDSSFECFNLWQPVLVENHTREKTILIFLESYNEG